MIPVILRGDTARGITLSPAPGYDYGGCTLEVEFNGARRAFDGLAAGAGVTLDLTADETARMPPGTGRVYMRLRNAAGEVLSLPWAKVKVTDAPGEVRAAQITIDPASLDVEDATAGDSLGAVKSKLNAVLAFLRGVAVLAVCALPCFGAEVAPLYTTPNDMPGDAPLMTNAAEYVDAVVDAKADKTALEAHVGNKNNPHGVTAAQIGALPLTGGTLTGDLTVNGFVYGKMLGIEGEIAFADDGSGTVGIVGGGGRLGFFSTSDPLNPKESALVPDGSKVMTETLTNEKLGGYATKADVAAKADKTNVYTRGEVDAKVNAVSNKADEAYSAAEQMVDAVNSLSGTVGAHIQNTSNPHKVTAAQVGALPIIGGTLTGDLAVGEEHTASRKLTVAATNGADGITLRGGDNSAGSGVIIGGSDFGGGYLKIQRGKYSGGTIHVYATEGSYGSAGLVYVEGRIIAAGTRASIMKNDEEVATEAYVDDKVKNAVLPTDPTFSNAVLAVGLNIDTDSVAVLNEIASTFGGFPIEGTATTVGGLLAALAAAVAWLRKNKADKATTLAGYGITDAATKTELNALAAKVDAANAALEEVA